MASTSALVDALDHLAPAGAPAGVHGPGARVGVDANACGRADVRTAEGFVI